MQIVMYTIPEPGTVGLLHDQFVDAIADLDLEWSGDDCGICVTTPGGEVTLAPGTRTQITVGHPILPNHLTVFWEDGTSTTFSGRKE